MNKSSEIDRIVAHHEEPLNAKLGIRKQIPKGVQDKMTEKDCVALMRKICKARPDVVVSRDWWRKNSGLADKTWTQFFGKFSQFKQAAGIKLDRRANRLLLQVAKHSAADDLRALNVEKRSYAEKYNKPSTGRWKTILLSSDTHDKDCDPFAQRVYLDVARRLGSAEGCGVLTDIVHLGDLFDAPEFGRYDVDPRVWDPVGRIRWVHTNHFEPLRKFCPTEEFTLLEGNHELRISALLAAQTPAVKVVLSDLHGMTISSFLGLDKYEVNYVANGDLAAVDFTKGSVRNELEKNYWIWYNCFLGCHYPSGKTKGLPGAHGHHHKHLVWSFDSPVYGAYEWHQLGGMCSRYAGYCDAEKWNNGFSIVHIDTKTKSVQFEYINVGPTSCMAAGVWYERKRSELLGKV